MDSFQCSHCFREVFPNQSMGTKHRNHCPNCLWSKHVDQDNCGDRKSACQALMEPIGLTFKKEGLDKWGKEKPGELMLVHLCQGCGKISINRIAADDKAELILEVFDKSFSLDSTLKSSIQGEGVKLLDQTHQQEVNSQLFGPA